MINCCTIRNNLLCCSLNHSPYQNQTHTNTHNSTVLWMMTPHNGQPFTGTCAKHNSSGFRFKLSLGKHPRLHLLYFASTYCTLWSDLDNKLVFNTLLTFLSYWHIGVHIKPPSMGWPNHCLKSTFFTNAQQNSM